MNVAVAIVMVGRARIRYSIFQKHARNPTRGQPVADFRALKVDCQNRITAARKHHYPHARIPPLRRVDRHCWTRHLFHRKPRPSRDEILGPVSRLHMLLLRGRLRIRYRSRPYRHLRMSRRWLPHRLLRADPAARNQHANCKTQAFITISTVYSYTNSSPRAGPV